MPNEEALFRSASLSLSSAYLVQVLRKRARFFSLFPERSPSHFVLLLSFSFRACRFPEGYLFFSSFFPVWLSPNFDIRLVESVSNMYLVPLDGPPLPFFYIWNALHFFRPSQASVHSARQKFVRALRVFPKPFFVYKRFFLYNLSSFSGRFPFLAVGLPPLYRAYFTRSSQDSGPEFGGLRAAILEDLAGKLGLLFLSRIPCPTFLVNCTFSFTHGPCPYSVSLCANTCFSYMVGDTQSQLALSSATFSPPPAAIFSTCVLAGSPSPRNRGSASTMFCFSLLPSPPSKLLSNGLLSATLASFPVTQTRRHPKKLQKPNCFCNHPFYLPFILLPSRYFLNHPCKIQRLLAANLHVFSFSSKKFGRA